MTELPARAQQALQNVVDSLLKIKRLMGRLGFRTRPITGGVFGVGEFELRSLALVTNGLDSVVYCVVHVRTELLVTTAHKTKEAALAEARALLVAGPPDGRAFLERVELELMRRQAVAKREAMAAIEKAKAEEPIAARQRRPAPRLSRRRRRIFEEGSGKCFYCHCELDLEGKWHVEHKMPKSLGGTNEPGNLVASCAPCNLKKRDRTAEEYIALRANEVEAST